MPTDSRMVKLVATFVVAFVGSIGSVEDGFSVPREKPPVVSQSGQQTPGLNGQVPPGPTLQRRNPRYVVGSSDVLDLTFQFTPEFDQTVTVQPDGYISLRSVGDIHVAGKSAPEVKAALEQAYSKILKDPVISVTLKEFEKPYFLALGKVGKPGKYDIHGDSTTVTEAVALAGGLDDKAKHSQVLVFRRISNDWVEVKEINLKRMLDNGDLREDVQVWPGDMVYVPQNTISKIKPFIPFPTIGYYLH